jgi:hypothetical protein
MRKQSSKKMEPPPGAPRIRAAQKENERFVIRQIKRAGGRWEPLNGLTSMATYNAIKRLEAAGRIRWVSRKYFSSGYELVPTAAIATRRRGSSK